MEKRIWDHETATYGKGTIGFRRSDTGLQYSASYDQIDQDKFRIEVEGTTDTVVIWNKSVSDTGVFSISGMFVDRRRKLTIEGAWVELTLSDPPLLHFYGDRVLIRTDSGDLRQ